MVQEKVDGSQFSFSVINRELMMRSRGAQVYPETADKLFKPAVETAQYLQGSLIPGWVYRGEAIGRPKHNTLAYNRIPRGGFVLFDVMTGPETYVPPNQVADIAEILNLETVPTIDAAAVITDPNVIRAYLERESFLGGPKVEGVVVKNYQRFTIDGKPMMGKIVSEAFKEKHSTAWRASNPGRNDVIENLIVQLRTNARWDKSIQHSRDAGVLEHSQKDIGGLLKAIHADLESEEMEFITAELVKRFLPHIKRGVAAGFAEYYKQRLLDQAF